MVKAAVYCDLHALTSDQPIHVRRQVGRQGLSEALGIGIPALPAVPHERFEHLDGVGIGAPPACDGRPYLDLAERPGRQVQAPLEVGDEIERWRAFTTFDVADVAGRAPIPAKLLLTHARLTAGLAQPGAKVHYMPHCLSFRQILTEGT